MKKKIYLIAHNIRSAYNIGSIFRTADAFSASKIYLTGYSPDPSHKKVLKTALGAEKMAAWEKKRNISDVINVLKKDKVKIIVLENYKDGQKIQNFKIKEDVAIILGNEIQGLNKRIIRKADFCLQIPMLGGKESLNVAVSAGIALYHFKYFS